MNDTSEYKIERAWFMVPGMAYAVAGYHDPRNDWNGFACPAFDRDGAELVVELLNRDGASNVLEWYGDTITPTDAGVEEGGYVPVHKNMSIAGMDLWWVGAWAWCWMVVEEPDPSMFHLEFKPRDEDHDCVVYGSGRTLIQALASLEAALITQFGNEAAFHRHGFFMTRDITDIVEALETVGGVFSCYDFSAPEDSFTIRRIPSDPHAVIVKITPTEIIDQVMEHLQSLKTLLPLITTKSS